MKKIKKILFPTDFSEVSQNAFRYAIWFADKCGADIDLLHVVYPETEPMDFPVAVTRATQDKVVAAKEVMKIVVESSLVQVQVAHQLKNVPTIRPEINVGAASSIIPVVAKNVGADLIIMGTQGEHSSFERAFGSVSTSVLKKAECPVLVVPMDVKFEHINTVAYATNFEESDPYHIYETGKILSPFHSIFRVIHISNGKEKRPLNMEDVRAFFDGRTPALQITFHEVVSENVVDELEDFANTWDVDLMVMYKPRRNFFERLFHKSVIRKEAFNTHVPLLVLK